MTTDGSGLKLDGMGLPLWLLLELTYRCPLKCPWCNNPVDFDRLGTELTTAEWKRVLREARSLGSIQLGLSGGEPLMRHDLEEIVAEAESLGFYTNLITSGIGLKAGQLTALKEAGLKQVQLSIQAADAELNDRLAGARCFDMKIRVAREIKAAGFPMIINIPVSRYNIGQAGQILSLAEELGADFVEFANIQYYGWGLLNRQNLFPTNEQLRQAEQAVCEARARVGGRMVIYFVVPDYHEGFAKPCMRGWGSIFLTIGAEGRALPCQMARSIRGIDFPNVRDASLEWIWHQSPAFNVFRGDAWMKEPCTSCEKKESCYAGCRCQAFLLTGDAANPDPACRLSPDHGIVERALADAQGRDHSIAQLVMRRGGLNLSESA